MAELNKVEEYRPTPAEAKLLKVLLNPEFATASMAEKIQEAGISHQKYYDCFKNPEFVNLLKKSAVDLIKKDVAPLVNVAIKQAKNGSFYHWRVLMEMAGMYTEKKISEHTVTLEQALRELKETDND